MLIIPINDQASETGHLGTNYTMLLNKSYLAQSGLQRLHLVAFIKILDKIVNKLISKKIIITIL